MKDLTNNIGVLRQAVLEQAKSEVETAEKRLKEYEKLQSESEKKLEGLEYGSDEYLEEDKIRKDLAVKVGLTLETIAEYNSFID